MAKWYRLIQRGESVGRVTRLIFLVTLGLGIGAFGFAVAEIDETEIADDFEAAFQEAKQWENIERQPAAMPFGNPNQTIPSSPEDKPSTAPSGDSGGPGNEGGPQGLESRPIPGGIAPTTIIDKTPRKAILNFDDELVEGGTQKPELFYLFQKKNFNYKRLIKLRENFIPEMRKTAEDVQRVRGPN